MAKNLTQLVDTAEKELITTMSRLLRHQFENGVDILMELDSSLKDEYIRVGQLIAEQVIPPKKNDVEKLLSTDMKLILEGCDKMKEIGAVTTEEFATCSIYDTLKKGVGFIIVKYFIDYAENIKERIFINTCELVSSQYTEEQRGNRDFILSLLEETGHGWPLIIAKNDLDKDPEVVLKAYQNDSWALNFADKSITEKIGEKPPIEALTALISSIKPIKKQKNKP